MERVNVIFLHGFLGRPSDWSSVKAALPSGAGVQIYTPDYVKDPELGPQHDFDTWADNFIRWTERVVGFHHRTILVGYSLGGRLALHALEKRPDIWDKVILISTNPGFNDTLHDEIALSEERKKRWLSDSYWAEEFSTAPWDVVLRNWNAQPVFGGGTSEPLRLEKDYSRENLGLILTQWSLAQQRNLRAVLAQYSEKIHWMVGEADDKFMELSAGLKKQLAQLKLEVIPAAGHRVPFDNPKALGLSIRNLLK